MPNVQQHKKTRWFENSELLEVAWRADSPRIDCERFPHHERFHCNGKRGKQHANVYPTRRAACSPCLKGTRPMDDMPAHRGRQIWSTVRRIRLRDPARQHLADTHSLQIQPVPILSMRCILAVCGCFLPITVHAIFHVRPLRWDWVALSNQQPPTEHFKLSLHVLEIFLHCRVEAIQS